MNWKFWQWPAQIRELKSRRRYILRGWDEKQMAEAFSGARGNRLMLAVLEQADQMLMEGVNDLLNDAEKLTDKQVRQRIGQLRGYTLLREELEAREALQTNKD